MNKNIQSATTLDTSGKCCPLPMVETNKAMKLLSDGDVLQIIATDPGTRLDIPSWCERTGHELLTSNVEGNVYKYYIRK